MHNDLRSIKKILKLENMPRKNPTSVVFTKKASPVVDKLSGIYGLKALLSAAVLYFNELDANERNERISAVNEMDKNNQNPQGQLKIFKEKLNIFKQEIQYAPGEVIRLLSKEEQEIVEDIRRSLGPDILEDNNKKHKKS